jgi:hypothetical protein
MMMMHTIIDCVKRLALLAIFVPGELNENFMRAD